jgi:hypothetical protein
MLIRPNFMCFEVVGCILVWFVCGGGGDLVTADLDDSSITFLKSVYLIS